jgi:hypothetical protein
VIAWTVTIAREVIDMEPKGLPIESQVDIPPDSWDSAPTTGCGKGENPLFSIVEGKGVEQDVSVRNDLSLLSAEESLSQKILPHVRSLVKAKKSGDTKAKKYHEKAINKLAGKKVIPRAFTEKEMESPEKLAKVISCISQVKEKGDGVNPFAVCREQIMGAPETKVKDMKMSAPDATEEITEQDLEPFRGLFKPKEGTPTIMDDDFIDSRPKVSPLERIPHKESWGDICHHCEREIMKGEATRTVHTSCDKKLDAIYIISMTGMSIALGYLLNREWKK